MDPYVFLGEDLGTVKILMYNKKKERLISLSFLLKNHHSSDCQQLPES